MQITVYPRVDIRKILDRVPNNVFDEIFDMLNSPDLYSIQELSIHRHK